MYIPQKRQRKKVSNRPKSLKIHAVYSIIVYNCTIAEKGGWNGTYGNNKEKLHKSKIHLCDSAAWYFYFSISWSRVPICEYDLAYGRGRKNGDCAKLRVRNKRCRFFALSAVSSLFEKAGTNRWTFYPCTSSGSMQFFGSKTCFLFVHSALRNGIVPVSGDIGKRGPLPVFQTGEGSHASGAYGWYLLCPWDLPAVSK